MTPEPAMTTEELEAAAAHAALPYRGVFGARRPAALSAWSTSVPAAAARG